MAARVIWQPLGQSMQRATKRSRMVSLWQVRATTATSAAKAFMHEEQLSEAWCRGVLQEEPDGKNQKKKTRRYGMR